MSINNGSPTRARLLGLALLMVMFVAGALSGMAMTRAAEAKEGPAEESPSTHACHTEKKRILDQVGLSAAQQTEVDRILARRRGQTEAFWDSAGPRLRELADSTRAEVRTVLTDEQRETYDRLREARRLEHQREKQEREREKNEREKLGR